MNITALRADGFRNLRAAGLSPCPGVNVLYGRNGQGKTSALEAVWTLCTGGSFRTARISEAIGFSLPYAKLFMSCQSQNRGLEVEFTLERAPAKKTVTVNGVPRRPGGELASFPAVVFRPEDLDLVKAGPGERRALLDTLGEQLSPRYRKNLAEYNRCLAQRNSLLRGLSGRSPDAKSGALLDVLDVALARLGVYLTRARQTMLGKLAPEAETLYTGVSGGAERFALRYESGFFREPMSADPSEAELYCCERLNERRRDDIGAGFTTLGAHRDDLALLLDERPARVYGSQGQQRTCAVVCRLGSARVLEELCGEPPVVLLDDVFSELDPNRCRYILDTVGNCQIFLTGCDLPLLLSLAPENRPMRRFLVEAGQLREDE